MTNSKTISLHFPNSWTKCIPTTILDQIIQNIVSSSLYCFSEDSQSFLEIKISMEIE